jgi:hypothetical protein
MNTIGWSEETSSRKLHEETLLLHKSHASSTDMSTAGSTMHLPGHALAPAAVHQQGVSLAPPWQLQAHNSTQPSTPAILTLIINHMQAGTPNQANAEANVPYLSDNLHTALTFHTHQRSAAFTLH